MASARARDHSARGESAWLTPNICTFTTWQAQLASELSLSLSSDALAGQVPINAHQSLLIWQSIIDHDVFVGEPQVAQLALAASGAVETVSLSLEGTLPADLATRKAVVEQCVANRIRGASFVPAQQGAKLDLRVDM